MKRLDGHNPGRRHRRSRAFTVIELLVVIVVISLLLGLIVVTSRAMSEAQKRRNTLAVMSSVKLAIDQFSAENPLKFVYDLPTSGRGGPTFGSYPPYTIVADNTPTIGRGGDAMTYVQHLFMKDPSRRSSADRYLEARLSRDLDADEVRIYGSEGDLQDGTDDGHDDIRALHTYLEAFVPDALSDVPDRYRKTIPTDTDDQYYQLDRNDPLTRHSIRGFVDAWGVPMDYFLQVRIAYKSLKPGTPSSQNWTIVDVVPTLRSRGITREEYDKLVNLDDPEDRLLQPGKWIFSNALSTPHAKVRDPELGRGGEGGEGLIGTGSNMNAGEVLETQGWLRAKGVNEDFGYRPDQDPFNEP